MPNLAFVDMAFTLTSPGARRAAERAMKAALRLAPDAAFVPPPPPFDRPPPPAFVKHYDDGNGREIILRSERTRVDPWLVAAELALSSREAAISPAAYLRGGWK